MKHEICKIADIPQTGSLIAPFFGREVHVWRSGERIRAAANICLHFGGPLDCKDGSLVCQCMARSSTWIAASVSKGRRRRVPA
ncbi:Rieske (2Fe-2S) protein [Mesorhizobium sp. CA4]|uniref:Rieske (2Fe-2S) protein n=1 Tax=Mesorhizobium sp. CA4 TaxID=588499 RepID=UPI001CD096F7|nr:Rieske 2Fe-2S domain-containing protein [Mesorhizobium sp. CA4]MBZ9819303.1 Rieske 2Fe-2S domain-containing protein [Mesorhizobium sp. CA4]